MEFETIIGLEVHAQLLTQSKMYCGCSAAYASAEPNTHVCPVCLGLPGALPVINETAVSYTLMAGLALGCSIPAGSKFDRKNYPYPDLVKGYQISQYDLPFCIDGRLDLETAGGSLSVGIRRVHLEEDTARLVHRSRDGHDYSLVDVNRSGVPLMEIVSEPDLRSPEDARAYLIALRQILRYLGISSGNMEEGAFRCDANISQRSLDGSIVGPKVEIKNMNSFRSVERALQFEVERQRRELSQGGMLVQETRGWVETSGITVSQRAKEYADDYRYFPEPDLPPVFLREDNVSAIRKRMPELPAARRERFATVFGIDPADAAVLTEDAAVADYFELALQDRVERAPRMVPWVSGELFALMRERGFGIDEVPVRPEHVSQLVDLVAAGTITNRSAKEVLLAIADEGKGPDQLIAERNLAQVSDEGQLAAVVAGVLDENPAAVADYVAGKKQAIGALLGQVMRQMRGTANPGVARKLLEDELSRRSDDGAEQ